MCKITLITYGPLKSLWFIYCTVTGDEQDKTGSEAMSRFHFISRVNDKLEHIMQAM